MTTPQYIDLNCPLCLTGEFVTKIPKVQHLEFVQGQQRTKRDVKPSDTITPRNKTVFVSKPLLNFSRVFAYNNAASSFLKPVYFGPFIVKHRAPKYFNAEIKRNIKNDFYPQAETTFHFEGRSGLRENYRKHYVTKSCGFTSPSKTSREIATCK
ncbi:hypothetical protein TNCV_3797151 [Trichonephila clavipes]|nr:hypothetical protein TNCV_3797151 [Trichonephila clavipes]